MKIIKKEELSQEKLIEVGKAINIGKVVIFPTETVYGIGTNALREDACNKIYEIKKRPQNKPLIVLISNLEMLRDLVEEISPLERKLMNVFWPGPLTIIFKKKKGISDIVTGGQNTLAVRLTSNKITQELIEQAGVPIVAPSANVSGEVTGTKIDIIKKELGDKVDYILDYGDIDSDIPSTLVKVENDLVMILREGKITKDEINNIL